MKTFLMVIFSLMFLAACSPEAARVQPALLKPAEAKVLLASLAPGDSSQVSEVAQAQPAGDAQPLGEVRDLAAQRRARLDRSGSWLHIQSRNQRSHPDLLSAIATGLDQYVQDEWLALDENGQPQQGVRKITTENGKLLQVILLKHGAWNNLTLGVQSQAGAGAVFDPNYGFDELAARLVRQGFSLNKSLLYKECWYQGEKYTISEGHLMHEAVFKTDDQALRWVKTWQVAENGDVSLVDSLEIMIEEQVSVPPADVLALLQQPLAAQ